MRNLRSHGEKSEIRNSKSETNPKSEPENRRSAGVSPASWRLGSGRDARAPGPFFFFGFRICFGFRVSDFGFSSSEVPLDVLYQVLHNEALLRANIDATAAPVKVVRNHRPDRRNLRTLQPLLQCSADATFRRYLIQSIDLRRAGEH